MRVLSGVQPSGGIHIGNFFGAIQQFVDLQHENETLCFIADLHALTTIRDGKRLRELSLDVALTYLALGLEPEKAILFRQSDIPEIPELYWVLMAITPMGLLERAVSYKDKTSKGIPSDAGLFSYPVLQAADILLYGSDLVPVGKDQVQHVEITRDIAIKFNLAFVPGWDPADPDGEQAHPAGILRLPQALTLEATAVVPGTDGQKMSKSYGNSIEVFASDADVKKQIMSIKSDSTPLEAPKPREGTAIYPLLKLFASSAELAEIERSFDAGGRGWGHYKQDLLAMFHAKFDAARKRRTELERDPAYVESLLKLGAERARVIAEPIMKRVREVAGLR